MSDPIFDLDSWEPMFRVSDGLAIDAKGRFSMRMGENMAMDMETGELHFTTPWTSEDGDPHDGL